MARRIIDISIVLDNETPVDQRNYGPRIEYQSPAGNTAEILGCFPGFTVEQLASGKGWCNETVTLRSIVESTWMRPPAWCTDRLVGAEKLGRKARLCKTAR